MQSFVTLIGHILGFISVGLFFYSYQRTQKRKIMIIQTVATAAVRQASNNEQIIQMMEQESGLNVTILSEEEEAYFGFLAVVNSMDTPSAVTIDIGGGSTEITLFKNKKATRRLLIC